MPQPRSPRLLAAVLLLVLAGGAVWLAWSQQPSGAGGDGGVYAFSVVGPDGPWWNSTITLPSGATVLSLTQAAAAGNFTVVVEQQALGAYVKAIGPYHETATGGWNFCIDSGAGYVWQSMAADKRPLHHGERVQWRWAENGSEVC